MKELDMKDREGSLIVDPGYFLKTPTALTTACLYNIINNPLCCVFGDFIMSSYDRLNINMNYESVVRY